MEKESEVNWECMTKETWNMTKVLSGLVLTTGCIPSSFSQRKEEILNEIHTHKQNSFVFFLSSKKKKVKMFNFNVCNYFWSSSTSWTSLCAASLSPGISVVHKVKLSRKSCIINVESKSILIECFPSLFFVLPLYVSSLNVSNSAIASSKALKNRIFLR